MATQLGFPIVEALTTQYSFTSGGVGVNLSFTTPQIPGNWEALSRQTTYVEWTVFSVDGASHSVEILFDAGAEVVTGGYSGEEVEWDRPVPGAMRLGLTGQMQSGFNITARLLASREPHQRQDFGFVYVIDGLANAAPQSSSVIAAQADAHAAFSVSGALPGSSGDAKPPAPITLSNNVVGALAWGTRVHLDSPAVTIRALLHCDEVVGILNYDEPLPGYWRKDYPVGDTSVVPVAALSAAVTQGDALLTAARAFNDGEAALTLQAGGFAYSAVSQLTYRQVLGANAVVWNGSAVWVYQKEISSDGDLSTLDVIFPAAPQLLYHDNASLLRGAIEPHLYLMSGFNPHNHFTQNCATHSLGKWPVVDAGNGGCGMPMESTGDMLLMAAGVTQAQGGDASWLQPYLPLLRRFADFCLASLPFPAPQDMTDDFSHAPGNLTNLALKCILGVAAQAYVELAWGNSSGAAVLAAAAREEAEFFMENAWSTRVSTPHFRFIYNDTWADSSGLMYNALWARLLGVESLFPAFYPKFQAHFAYLATLPANSTWCIPLSSMEKDSKWDWLVHTAALMYTVNSSSPPAPSNYSNLIFTQLYHFANATNSNFPLTDHPECTGPTPVAAADRARPVLGAFYAPLLIASPPLAVSRERARMHLFLQQQQQQQRWQGGVDGAVAVVSWFSASDTHLGHDPVTPNGTVVTSYTKNVWAIGEMNALPGRDTWPDSLGGGPVSVPVGVIISGDLIDAGDASGESVNGCHQWDNFTALYGLKGDGDGLLRYRVYEGRGNHDGGNSSAKLPSDCSTVPSRAIAARNEKRASDPDFSIDSVSTPTGLHYSWTWNLTTSCRLHFVHLNLFPGHACGSPGNPGREGKEPGGFLCGGDGWMGPEDSLGFLQADLALHAGEPGTWVVAIQHYGYDGWSNVSTVRLHRVKINPLPFFSIFSSHNLLPPPPFIRADMVQ